jgi:acyl carrier protein
VAARKISSTISDPRHAAAAAATARTDGATSSDVERRVIEVVTALASELGTLPARGGAALDDLLDRDLGLGSLERVELALRLEQAFAVQLGDAVLAEAERCRDLVAAVASAGAPVAETEPPAVVLPRAGDRVPAEARTLTEVLAWHAAATPDRVHVVLRLDTGAEEPITYGALAEGARAVAAALQARGVRAGDRIAIMLRTEPAFFRVFFGVLLAGAVPVPIYPPFRPGHLEEYARRQVGILRNAEVLMLVTFAEVARVGRLVRRRVPTLETVVTAEELITWGAPGAPQTPQRSGRPGAAVAPLDNAPAPKWPPTPKARRRSYALSPSTGRLASRAPSSRSARGRAPRP